MQKKSVTRIWLARLALAIFACLIVVRGIESIIPDRLLYDMYDEMRFPFPIIIYLAGVFAFGHALMLTDRWLPTESENVHQPENDDTVSLDR